MFSESNIQELKTRLGWSKNEKLEYVNKLNNDNTTSDSGLTLNYFHKLVTVENIYACHPISNLSDTKLNTYLDELLDNVIREILTDIFVLDSKADSGKDYTSTISEMVGTGLFDTCIGYCHSVKVLELYVSSIRSNRIESILDHDYSQLMGELKGFSTKDGVLISKGILSYCEDSRDIIREKMLGASNGCIEDGTNMW